MFAIETTWQGKRSSQSWLTCLSLSKSKVEAYVASQVDPRASHRLLEVPQDDFPVFFVSVAGGYRHVTITELRALLLSASVGEPEQILFNVYRFSSEYMWSTSGFDLTAHHIHVFNESLSQYRQRKGELAEVIGYEE